MLTCKVCDEQTTLDELTHHPDIEPVSIDDYTYCPHCEDSQKFTSSQGDVNFQ